MCDELRGMEQALFPGLQTGLDRGWEQSRWRLRCPRWKLQGEAEWGLWSPLSLSPSGLDVLFACLRGVSVTCHQGSQVVQGLTRFRGQGCSP